MQSTKVDVNVSADCDADAGADSSRQLGALLVPLARITLAPPSSPSLPFSLSVCLLLFGPPLLIYASRRQAKQQIEFRWANK